MDFQKDFQVDSQKDFQVDFQHVPDKDGKRSEAREAGVVIWPTASQPWERRGPMKV